MNFLKKNEGKIIYDWFMKNASKFGFCKPYNELSKRNQKGYYLEKWHWSYYPIAFRLQQEWEKQYKNKKITFYNKFSGSKVLQTKALDYVTSVNKSCLKLN